ncbi:MAG: gliding motility protein GldC [Bacteroidetes bacterium]|nr:gliding motility protein GldC [Bacteroidota bacterium]MBS1634066.1 gliding motility protein GldC [Bacteroidota bacterium]
MNQSKITIDVTLDDNRMPQDIQWNASDAATDEARQARAMMLAFWDGAEKTALRIDIWTKEMMVDEMADFFYQTLMTMADTFNRATRNEVQAEEMKKFAHDFYHKAQQQQMKQNPS